MLDADSTPLSVSEMLLILILSVCGTDPDAGIPDTSLRFGNLNVPPISWTHPRPETYGG